MTILGPESIHAVPRITPITWDSRNVYVQEPIAKELDLHDGQIVQATVSIENDHAKLLVQGHALNVPLFPYIKSGDLVQLRAHLLPKGLWVLELLHTGTFAGPDLPVLSSDQNIRAKSLNILPENFSNWISLLTPKVVEGLIPIGTNDQLKNIFLNLYLNQANLKPQVLKSWFEKQLRSTEFKLLNESSVEMGPKELLRMLLLERTKSGIKEVDIEQQLSDAIDELESSQLKTVQDLVRGDLSMSFVIPFTDAEPVVIQFEKKAQRNHSNKSSFFINIYTNAKRLGEVWLKTAVLNEEQKLPQVDITMWAVRQDIAQMADLNSPELGYELESAGLEMHSFKVFNARRPDADKEQHLDVGDSGSIIDTMV
jgi:hypothetical protein